MKMSIDVFHKCRLQNFLEQIEKFSTGGSRVPRLKNMENKCWCSETAIRD